MRGHYIIATLIVVTFAAASGIAHAQSPDTRKDEEVIKDIIDATTDAFSKDDARTWCSTARATRNWSPCVENR